QGTAIAWPPIGPDVTSGDISGVGGHAYKIPARRCDEAMVSPGTTNGNGAYNAFNPTGCYRGVGGGTAPSAPANLRVQQVHRVAELVRLGPSNLARRRRRRQRWYPKATCSPILV